MTVEELGRRMSPEEFADWKAFVEIEADKADLDMLGGMVARSLTD